MADDKIKNATKTSSRPSNPGGHSGHGVTGRNSTKNSQNSRNNSALSRFNRTRWDYSDGQTGGEMSYQYSEYPKHVYPNPDNLKYFVEVNNEEEERAVLGGEEVVREEDEHERLLTIAKINNIQVDKRWGITRLTNTIEKAGFDPTANPFE